MFLKTKSIAVHGYMCISLQRFAAVRKNCIPLHILCNIIFFGFFCVSGDIS